MGPGRPLFYLSLDAVKGVKKREPWVVGGRGVRPAARRMLALLSLLPHAHAAR